MATFANFETSIEPLAGLMREHVVTHGLVERTEDAIEEAVASRDDAARAEAAMNALADLEAHLANDLVTHIAKEEEVLFPALVGFAEELDKVIDEMVEQHDEIRLRKANIERALKVVHDTHQELDEAQAHLAAAMASARAGSSPSAVLDELLDAVKRLRWILEGHFGDEEDDLFPPAVELLSLETWEDLARRAEELERGSPA